jgi:phenylpropionate dioxygenase-like ring-hydroxylating dioxygenase large terminal subunit
MIPNQWYAVLESNEVRRGKPVCVTRLGEKLVFWRDSRGAAACFRDLCPHRGVALSGGQILHDHLQCPFHGLQFDTTGKCTVIPANGASAPVPKAFHAHAYPTHEAHGFIWVWWGEAREDLPPVRFFETLEDAAFSYATIRDHWPIHYSRAVENQLDPVHLPFVHTNTIGRGGRTVINGPLTRWSEDDLMEIWVDNRVDRGQRALRPSEMPEPTRHPQLQFRFPNIWHNWIGDDARVFAAFAPIDDENTMMYVRFYQRFVRVPGLREVVNWLSRPMNRRILNEDKRVVITHRPKRSDLRIGEQLFQGDGPIIDYRRRRSELIDRAGQGM